MHLLVPLAYIVLGICLLWICIKGIGDDGPQSLRPFSFNSQGLQAQA